MPPGLFDKETAGHGCGLVVVELGRGSQATLYRTPPATRQMVIYPPLATTPLSEVLHRGIGVGSARGGVGDTHRQVPKNIRPVGSSRQPHRRGRATGPPPQTDVLSGGATAPLTAVRGTRSMSYPCPCGHRQGRSGAVWRLLRKGCGSFLRRHAVTARRCRRRVLGGLLTPPCPALPMVATWTRHLTPPA